MDGYWKGRTALVTGAAGFIGSHLVEALVRQGARVRAHIRYNSSGNRGWLETLDPELAGNVEIFAGDVRDYARTLQAVTGMECVFHLASLIAIPYSYHAPESYVQTNVCGGLNVLSACRAAGVARIVHTSTSEVYGTARRVPIDESHPLQGQSPYSASKIGADMLAESFHRSFDLPVAIIRPFNTYGPRQSARAVIPTILSQLYAGATEIRLGVLSPTRDFNFVADTVEGFLCLGRAEAAVGKVVNIGSGREISIGALVALLCEITGKRAEIRCDETRLRPAQSEVERLLCDASLAARLLGWKPGHTLEQGLEITARWVKDHPGHFRPAQFAM